MPQQSAGAPLVAHVLALAEPWAASSAPAGYNCPAATVSSPAHALQGGGAAGFASGHHGDAGQPWKRESLVERGGLAVGGPWEGGRMGEAAAVEVGWDWGYSEWRSEGWEQTRRMRREML